MNDLRRARAIGLEHAEAEEQMIALNESLARDDARRARAVEMARENYGSDDVEIVPWTTATCDPMDTPEVQSVDGGYWIAARVWIDADEVELA